MGAERRMMNDKENKPGNPWTKNLLIWVGLFLVVLVLVGRDRLFRPWTWWTRKKA